MKLILLSLIVFLASCSQMKLRVDNKSASDIKFAKKGKYFEGQGAGDVLRGVSAATLMIRFRQTGDQKTPQDLIAFSIGSDKPSRSSRASLRIEPGGRLVAIARASDSDEAQNLRGTIPDLIKPGHFHTAALVVDYEKNEMHLFLDGRPVEAEGKIKFGAKMTADTPSASVAIGAEDDGSEFFFEGELQNPQVWKRRLSPEEILSLAQ